MDETSALEAGGEPQAIDPKLQEAFKVLAGRVMEALAQDPQGLDAALKADPVSGAVEYGSAALWHMVDAAEKAGRPMPFEVIAAAGMYVLKELGEIALQKGYLQDGDAESFLQQAFQQAIARYAQHDAKEGKLSEEDMALFEQAGAPSDGAMDEGPEPDADEAMGVEDNDEDERGGALAAMRGRA